MHWLSLLLKTIAMGHNALNTHAKLMYWYECRLIFALFVYNTTKKWDI